MEQRDLLVSIAEDTTCFCVNFIMKQSNIIKLVDLLSFLSLVTMLVTGLLIEYSLPPRSGSSEVWGLSRHDWGEIHFYGSLIFLALMAAHLLTHLKYLKSVLLGKAGREYKYRIAIGAVGLISLILVSIILLTTPVETGTKEKGWQHKASS